MLIALIFILFFIVYATGLIILCNKYEEPFIFLYGKGATAYELQIGNTVFRYCHLYGGNWKHPFQLSRFRVHYYPEG